MSKTIPERWVGDRLGSLQSCVLGCGLVEMTWAVTKRLKCTRREKSGLQGAKEEQPWRPIGKRMNGACAELTQKGLGWGNRVWECVEHSTRLPCLPVWLFLLPLYFLQHLPALLAHLHWSLFLHGRQHRLCSHGTKSCQPVVVGGWGLGGCTAHAQLAWPRDTIIGTCQAAAACFRKSTGAFIVLLLAGMVDPPSVGHSVSVLAPTHL